MQREGERFQMLVTVLQERWGAGVAGVFERAWRSEVLADCATFGEWLVMLPEEVPVPVSPRPLADEEPEAEVKADEDTLRMLMDLARRLEEQGNIAGAVEVYRQAQAMAPAGSGLAEELAYIVQALEAKQREATVPEPPPLPVEEVVGIGSPVRPPEEEEVVLPGPQPLPEEGMAAEAGIAASPPELPLEEAAVEPVAPTPGSALEKELALIAEGVGAKPQEEAPPLELQPPAVEVEAEVTVPPAGEEVDLDRLFDEGLAAFVHKEWAEARELLGEVTRRQPGYARGGYEAWALLAEADRRSVAPRRKRVSGWAWALLGLVFVIACIIYSNYQAERRALIEALKATASAQYQATVTVQAQATATARAQATAQVRAAVADSCIPDADQVALFVDSEYSGQCMVKGIGQYSNPGAIGLPNDSISSVMIGVNVQAALYEHDDYQGRSEVFTSSDSDLRSNTIGEDVVSSVKVQWRTSAVASTTTAQAQARVTEQAQAAATVQARATATVQAELGVITLENVSRVQRLRTLIGHYDRVTSVAFSPDGTLLASGSDDHTVRLWRSSDGAFLRSLQGHSGYVKNVAFSPDGTILASASDDRTVRLWRVSDGALLRTLEGHTGWVEAVEFAPDGRLLASGSCAKLGQGGWCEVGEIRLWLVPDGSLLRTLEGHTDWVTGVTFSPDGKTLASGAGDGAPRLWQVADGAHLRVLEPYVGGISETVFSPDGRVLAAGSLDGTVLLWQIEDRSLPQTLPAPGGVTDVVFNLEGTLLVAVGGPENSPKIWLWQIPDGVLPGEIDVGEGEVVRAVAINPLGNLIAAAFHDGAVRLYGIK
jgi:WD40 repeat protein